MLYRTLKHSATATAPAKADACVATRSNFASRRARDAAHDLDVPVRARHALQPHPPPHAAFDVLPAFDAELLSVAPLTLTRLMPLADTPLFAFFDQFLMARL